MPKATKKKKAKEADFKKAKLKLGKGKKPANNATDTSFKARSIALPGQQPLNRALAASAGSSTEPTTAQGLNLEDIFVRFRHPNAGVRKDALGGLKEILIRKPTLDVGKVLRALGGLVADDDAAVRKSLLGFLGWYIPLLPTPTLDPHLPMFLLQTSSALSHIFPEIRLDSARLVNLLLEHIPSYVVGGWPSASPSTRAAGGSGGGTILEGLRLALGVGETNGGGGGTTNRMTSGGKLVILTAILGFLRAALGEVDSVEGRVKLDERMWEGWEAPLRLSGPSARASSSGGEGRTIEVTGRNEWDAGMEEGWVVQPEAGWALESGVDGSWELGRLGGELEMEQSDAQISALTQLFDQLKSLLLNTFLEAAPTAFGVGGSGLAPSAVTDVGVSLCRVSASLVECLAGPILASPSPDPGVRQGVGEFLRRMSPYFPFPTSSSASGDISPGLSLSISYAQLATGLAYQPAPSIFPRGIRNQVGWKERVTAIEAAWATMRSSAIGSTGKDKGKSKVKSGAEDLALHGVSEWIVDLLAPPSDALHPPISPSTYAALLPVLFSLITQPPPLSLHEENLPQGVLVAFLEHLTRQSAISTTRSLGEQFLIRLIQIHESRFPTLPFYIPPGSGARPLIQAWIESLPKTLWEVGIRDAEATERILRFLLWVGLRGESSFPRPWSLVQPSAFPSITSKLAPYFHLNHPSRGDVPGPWTRLEGKSLRRLALDVAKVWLEWDGEAMLARAVIKAVEGDHLWGKIWHAPV